MLNLCDKFSVFYMPTFNQIAYESDKLLEYDRLSLKPMQFRDAGKFIAHCQKFHKLQEPLKFLVDGRINEPRREIKISFQKWPVNGPKWGILDCFDTPLHISTMNFLTNSLQTWVLHLRNLASQRFIKTERP